MRNRRRRAKATEEHVAAVVADNTFAKDPKDEKPEQLKSKESTTPTSNDTVHETPEQLKSKESTSPPSHHAEEEKPEQLKITETTITWIRNQSS